MANFCPSCGNRIEPGDRFCPSCGIESSGKAALSGVGSLKEAFKKMRCDLNLNEIFGILGCGEQDVIDWREARWSRSLQETEETPKGLFLLTRQNIFFILKTIWPGKLTKRAIESTMMVIPVSTIKEVKASKTLFTRKFKIIRIKGLVGKRGLFFRKERWTRETFFLEDSKSLAEKIKELNPNIKG